MVRRCAHCRPAIAPAYGVRATTGLPGRLCCEVCVLPALGRTVGGRLNDTCTVPSASRSSQCWPGWPGCSRSGARSCSSGSSTSRSSARKSPSTDRSGAQAIFGPSSSPRSGSGWRPGSGTSAHTPGRSATSSPSSRCIFGFFAVARRIDARGGVRPDGSSRSRIFFYLNYPGVRNAFVEHELALMTPEQRAAMAADAGRAARDGPGVSCRGGRSRGCSTRAPVPRPAGSAGAARELAASAARLGPGCGNLVAKADLRRQVGLSACPGDEALAIEHRGDDRQPSTSATRSTAAQREPASRGSRRTR